MYSLTNPKKIREEEKIEPRDPFIVLADKVAHATGVQLNDQQKKLFEQCVSTVLSASAGVSYALLSRQWKLDWVTGGVVFGGLFWAVEDEGLPPALGLVGDNTRYPLEAHLRGLAAHVVFGIVAAGLLKAAGIPEK